MQTELKTTENLLGKVSVIIEKHREIAKITGENFNIFRVLGLSTREVRTHSAFIAELLNPNGSHGKGDVFLRLFVEYLRIPFDTTQVRVEVEKRTNEGNLDIIILNNEAVIIIENKIYAPDQKDQLLRYKSYAEQRYKKKWILYLTLDGKESEDSIDKLQPKIDYFPISYKEDITKWLECCLKETTNFPLLRETLNQYIYLIKHLTNQTMSDEMKKELVQIIAGNPEYIKSAEKIADAWEASQFQIIKNLEKDIKDVAKDLGLQSEIDFKLGDETDFGFWFYNVDWCYCIYFYFESKFKYLLVGIDTVPNETQCPDEVKEKLKAHFADYYDGSINRGNWIWSSYISEWEHISWAEVKNKAPKVIKETTEKILDKLKAFRP